MNKRFFYILLFTCLALLLNACSYLRGSGNIVSEERTIQAFRQVEIFGAGELILSQGETESLTIEADDNLLPYIESQVRGDTLYLGLDAPWMSFIRPTRPLRFYLTVTDLRQAKIAGAGAISAQRLEVDDISFYINGSGEIRVDDLQAQQVSATINGSGRCEFDGQSEDQQVIINGSGKYLGQGLSSETTSVTINGSGNVNVWVESALSVNINGSGEVRYKGAPRLTQRIAGSGDIARQDD